MGSYTMGALDRNTPRRQRWACAVLMGLLTLWIVLTFALRASAQPEAALRSEVVTIRGTVRNSEGKPIGEALVHLQRKGVAGAAETKTDAAGGFIFVDLGIGSYQLSSEKSGLRSHSATVVVTSHGDRKRVELILRASGTLDPIPQSSSGSSQTMEFSDKPNFSVAGVTDWTAVGGHGSDSTLRTSEALASETSKLKAEVSGGTADSGAGAGHRVAGELAEQRGDPLAAVHEFEQAVQLDPSEENYFEWGSELLLHRAVWQAEQTLHRGADLYPKSARMLTGLGAALFAGARYDEAAARLCKASDLNPTDPNPYLFLGKIQIAAPDSLPCVEQKLARFVELQPANSLANYFYAMAILKRQKQSTDQPATEYAETLLNKAVTLDTKCSDGYLQLGIMSAARRDYLKAIDLYAKAVEANPLASDAHYRLGVAYDRIGERVKAKREFELHDKLKQDEAKEIERQRLEVKQFLVVQPGQPTFPIAK
jgi:Flp pilus assembly protein TadD